MKKDLSEKERKINNLLLINENLKKEIKDLKTQLRNKEQLENQSNKTLINNAVNIIPEVKNDKKEISENNNLNSKTFINNVNNNNTKYNSNELNFNFNSDNSFERLTKNSVFGNDENCNNLNFCNKNHDETDKHSIKNNDQQNHYSLLNTATNNLNIYNSNSNLVIKKNFSSEYDPYAISINNNNIKEILRENEYLKKKYNKYEKKYIKHKSVGKSLKKILKNFKRESQKEKGMNNIKCRFNFIVIFFKIYIILLIIIMFYQNYTSTNL